MMKQYLLALALISFAEISLARESRFEVFIAGYLPNINTQTRIDSRALNNGTTIDFENDFELADSEFLPAISLKYRASEKLNFELAYFDLSRSGEQRIEKNIQFGDETFEINELLRSKFNVNIYRLSMEYNFPVSTKWELGAGGGFHVTRFEVALEAPSRDVKAGVDKTAPLPYVSLNASYAITSSWYVGSHLEVMSVEIGSIEGSLFNAYLGLEYLFSDAYSAGLAYNVYDLSAKSDSLTTDLEGKFEYHYAGPMLFVKARF